LAATTIGGLATAGLFALLYQLGIVKLIYEWLSSNSGNIFVIIIGGGTYGVALGVALGLVIGLAIAFTNKWTERDVLEGGD
jgi:hypothetical protein